MDRQNFLFDVFLGGPMDEFAPIPNFRRIIKGALPELKMFDPFAPEYAEIQRQGQWFCNNMIGIEHSRSMIAMVPEFPMPCLGPEIGIFWTCHNANLLGLLPQLIIIWPDSIKPEYGKEILKRMGIVVNTVDDAIQSLKDYFQIIKGR